MGSRKLHKHDSIEKNNNLLTKYTDFTYFKTLRAHMRVCVKNIIKIYITKKFYEFELSNATNPTLISLFISL